MQHVERTTHDFISDDGRLAIYVELGDGITPRITLTKKNGPKVEFVINDLQGLAEITKGANEWLRGKTRPPLAQEG